MLQVAPQFGVVHGSLVLLPGSFFLLLPLGQHPSDLRAAKKKKQPTRGKSYCIYTREQNGQAELLTECTITTYLFFIKEMTVML